MKDLVARITQFMSDLRTKGNAALAKLPPLDQIQAGEEILSGIRTLGYFRDEAEGMAERLGKIEDDLNAYVGDEVAARIAAGELVDKETHTGAIAAAEAAERTKVEKEKDGEIAALRRMEGNRRTVAEALPAAVAAQVSDEILQLEDIAPVVSELSRRVTKLGEVGLSADTEDEAKKKAFARKLFVAACDEAGNQAFDEEISDLVALGARPVEAPKPTGTAAASVHRAAGTPPVTTPSAPATPAKRPVAAF